MKISKRNKILLGLLPCLIFMQTIVLSQSVRTLPAEYINSKKLNYVREWHVKKPLINLAELTINTTTVNAQMSTKYIDGLGRLIQTVIKKGSLETDGIDPISSLNAVDLVELNEYDFMGRESFRTLKFAANNEGGNTNISNGLFKFNPYQQQRFFYNGFLENQNEVIDSKNWAYSKSNFESSPLGRVKEVFSPGVNWVGSDVGNTEPSNNSVKTKYAFNTLNDKVKIWNVVGGGNDLLGSYEIDGEYVNGELSKIITEDENKNQTIEFFDKSGLLILKKQQLGDIIIKDNGNGVGYDGWLSTYYLYDEFKRLRAVIQPKGVEVLHINNWSSHILNDILGYQFFRYEYDSKDRLTIRKVPDGGLEYFVYDNKNRMVMSQDANQRINNHWYIMKYDIINRLIETGILINSSSFSTHLGSANASIIDYPSTSVNYEFLQKLYYDNYDWSNGYSSDFKNYEIISLGSVWINPSDITYPYPQAMPITGSSLTKGQLTGSVARILGSSPVKFIATINFYDKKERLVQARSLNEEGDISSRTTQFTWNGLPLIEVSKKVISNNTSLSLTNIKRMTYDELGRLIKTEHKVASSFVNNGELPNNYTTVSVRRYDALGNIKGKVLGHNYDGPGTKIEDLEYDYNIRGWLLGVNRKFLKSSTSSESSFGFELGYDKKENSSTELFIGTKQYNGNINGMLWKSKGDNISRIYDFKYDNTKRFLRADFKQQNSDDSWNNELFNFSVVMGGSNNNSAYDPNGNILRMQQWGTKITGVHQIDDLYYQYKNYSNLLTSVFDSQNDPLTKLEDFRTSVLHPYGSIKSLTTLSTIEDYIYDDNGRMIKDFNKDIGDINNEGITYNQLGLPSEIIIRKLAGAIKGKIKFIYDASGIKIRKEVWEAAQVIEYNSNSYSNIDVKTSTHYLGEATFESKEYINNSILNQELGYKYKLLSVAHEEGRIRYISASDNNFLCPTTPANRFIYDFFVKDHLENVRMVLSSAKDENTCYLPATLEASSLSFESQIYDITEARIEKVVDVANAINHQSLGDNFYRTHGNVNLEKTGLGVVLKVMSGDRVGVSVESFYNLPVTGSGLKYDLPVLDLLASFLSNSYLVSAKGVLGASTVAGLGLNTSAIGTFLNNNDPGTSDWARARLNWILFDDQLKYVNAGSDLVEQGGGYKLHTEFINAPVEVTKNGYIYVYVSNESGFKVFFDNLLITHFPGKIIEENHYYPFGLKMDAISSKASQGVINFKNKLAYNGYEQQNEEFSDGNGLEWYDYKNRFYDNQIGRFFVQDKLANDYVYYSPYQFAGNQVPNAIDLDGLEPSTPYRYTDPKQLFYEGNYRITDAMFNMWDRFTSIFSKNESEIEKPKGDGYSNIVNSSRTVTGGSSMSGWLRSINKSGSSTSNDILSYLFNFETKFEQTFSTRKSTTTGSVTVENDLVSDGSTRNTVTVNGVKIGPVRGDLSLSTTNSSSGSTFRLNLQSPGKFSMGVGTEVNKSTQGTFTGQIDFNIQKKVVQKDGTIITNTSSFGKGF